MLIGCPKEIKNHEYRVGLTPESVKELVLAGHNVLVEGGAWVAAAFLKAGLVDRLLLYRAPILLGIGKAALGEIGLDRLDDAHGRWRMTDARQLGKDRMELYEAV